MVEKQVVNRKEQKFKKVRREGGTRALTIGRLLPDDWNVVTTDKEGEGINGDGKEFVLIKVTKVG